MLSKDQIIAGIQQINRSARRDWLIEFDHGALRQYLDHLQQAIEPRGGHSIWVRRNDSPAIISREPAG
jgi:hypothetical protein